MKKGGKKISHSVDQNPSKQKRKKENEPNKAFHWQNWLFFSLEESKRPGNHKNKKKMNGIILFIFEMEKVIQIAWKWQAF